MHYVLAICLCEADSADDLCLCFCACKSRFSHAAAHIIIYCKFGNIRKYIIFRNFDALQNQTFCFKNLHKPLRTPEHIQELAYMSRIVRKPDFCLCENKGADQLRGNREADQHLCFRYSDSTIPLLLKSEISSF